MTLVLRITYHAVRADHDWKGCQILPVVDANGLRVSYTDAGSGMPVVFVPDITGSQDWFVYQRSGLADRYRVISYDLRQARGKESYTLELLTNDLARFLTKLKIRAAVIVGHSFGGLIAMQFAVSYPERCLALVLSSTAPECPNLSDEELLSHLQAGEVKFENWFERRWKKLFKPGRTEEEKPNPLGYLAKHSGNIDQPTLAARLRILRETDLTPSLNGVEAPTLIITGSLDTPYILHGSQVIEQKIEDSTLEVIEGAGHFAFYLRYDLYNDLLADFLAYRVVI